MVVLESWPFSSAGTGNTGQLPTEDRWSEFGQYLTTDGVAAYESTDILGVLNGDLEISENTLMQVQVNIGRCIIKGHFGKLDTPQVLAIGANSSGNPRIDTVIARLNKGTGVKNIEIVVKAGTPAGSPVAPTLTKNSTIFEIPLADIAVANGASSIVNANITDRRSFVTARRNPRRVIGKLSTVDNLFTGKGITSTTHPAVGRFACVFTEPMLNTDYVITAIAQSNGGKYRCEVQNDQLFKTGFEIRVYNSSDVLVDPNWVHVTAEEV